MKVTITSLTWPLCTDLINRIPDLLNVAHWCSLVTPRHITAIITFCVPSHFKYIFISPSVYLRSYQREEEEMRRRMEKKEGRERRKRKRYKGKRKRGKGSMLPLPAPPSFTYISKHPIKGMWYDYDQYSLPKRKEKGNNPLFLTLFDALLKFVPDLPWPPFSQVIAVLLTCRPFPIFPL